MFSVDFSAYKDVLVYNAQLLREIFYPRRCFVCGTVIDAGCFCADCRRSFLLQMVIKDVYPLREVFLLYKYEQQLKEILHGVKFENRGILLPLLYEEAKFALPLRPKYFFSDFDLVGCIPTSPERRKSRGFDVPERIFSFTEYDCQPRQVLERVRNTIPLYELEPVLRCQELQGCFRVNMPVTGKKILLCDDIYTTGSTMKEAACALLAAGAERVSALAFAASRDNWR